MQPKSTANHSQFRAALVSPQHQMVVRWADVSADTREAVEAQIAGLRAAAGLDGFTVMALEYQQSRRPPGAPAEAGGPRAFAVRVAGESLAHWGIHDRDVVWIDPDRGKGTRDLVMFRLLDANGRERGMHICDIDGVDTLLSLAGSDVLDPAGVVTWVVPSNPGFKPKHHRRSCRRAIEEPTTDWTADLWPSVRDQLADLLADN